MPIQSFVDVRDVAEAHRLAFELPQGAGQRFILSQIPYSPLEYLEFFAKEFPDRPLAKIPEGYATPLSHIFDGTKVQETLGLRLRDPEETLREAAKWVLSVLPSPK